MRVETPIKYGCPQRLVRSAVETGARKPELQQKLMQSWSSGQQNYLTLHLSETICRAVYDVRG